MPVAQNCLSSPLQTVQEIFEEGEAGWQEKVVQVFQEKLACEEAYAAVPSITEVENHQLREGQLLRFRCMVQDMFDPEYFMSRYKVKNLVDGSVKMVTGRYRDTLSCGPREEVVEDESCNSMDMTEDRLSFYCVSIPGSAPWVAEKLARGARMHGEPQQAAGTLLNPLKRSHGEEEGEVVEAENMEMEDSSLTSSDDKEPNKKPKNEGVNDTATAPKEGSSSTAPTNPLNLPLGGAGRGAVVKMYDLKDGEIKLNDLLEVVGIVSLDPALAQSLVEDESMGGRGTCPVVPPPSMVPRLHALTYKKLDLDIPRVAPLASSEVSPTREELLSVLTECLLGDKLAAEYTLLHLISRVYLRKDVLVLGKFCLNLHNMTSHDSWPRRLATVLSLFTTNHHFLPLTRQLLDSSTFTPCKDFEANRLVTGLLQLPAGMHLTLDETVMTDGQLKAQGLKNLTALGNLITWQKVEYNLFQALEFPSEVCCLVLSEGRSMLPSDFQLLVKPECEAKPDIIATKFRAVGQYLTAGLLDKVRAYVIQCKLTEYKLTEEVMKRVQDDFVELRKQEGGLTVEEFHSLLVLARLQSISQGRDSMEPQDWEAAKAMEKLRKDRASTLPQRAGAVGANGMPMHLDTGKV